MVGQLYATRGVHRKYEGMFVGPVIIAGYQEE